MNKKSNKAPDEMTSEFLVEIKEDLAGLEPDLLSMEEEGAQVDDELINHAFRSIHSIKGGAGFIDFKPLSELSHAMENVLMAIREKKLVINSMITDRLLSGLDKMKSLVDALGSDKKCSHEKETRILEELFQTNIKIETSTDETISNPDDMVGPETFLSCVGKHSGFGALRFPVDRQRLDKAIENQKFIYALKVPEMFKDDITSVGDILYSGAGTNDLNAEDDPDQKNHFFVVSTILDLPLLAQVLEIRTYQIGLLDKQFAPFEQILKGFGDTSEPEVSGEKVMSVVNVIETPEGDVLAVPDEAPDDQTEAEPESMSLQSSSTFHGSVIPTIRVNVDLISKLMNRAGELVLSRNQLRSFIDQLGGESARANHIMQNLDMVTTNIQETIMQMRMQPVIELLGKYRRVVRDIARRMDKKVVLDVSGSGVELDRNILEKLANPLTHIIRNCIDHGIESPDDRRKIGKSETGRILIETSQQSGHIHMSISDDGAGIDPQLVLSKAFEKGLVTEEQIHSMTDRQKVDLIFLPGFSTSRAVTDISGRGVGMDVVKTNIERLRGRIEVHTVKGKGCTIKLIFPLTLSIVPSLIVSSGNHKFALPRATIKETIFMEPGKIHDQVANIAGAEAIRLRKKLIPVLRLRNILDLSTYTKAPGKDSLLPEKRKAIADRRRQVTFWDGEDARAGSDRRVHPWDATYVIILKVGSDVFGLCVDEIHDIEEVVVEPLNAYIKHLDCYMGSTILGDGDVIMILDVPGIVSSCDLKFDAVRQKEMLLQSETSPSETLHANTSDLIVFANAEDEYFAIDLTQLTRLESLDASRMYTVENERYIRNNDQAIRLFPLEELLAVSPMDSSAEKVFVVFPKFLSVAAGIIASKIVDTVQCDHTVFEKKQSSGTVLNKIFIQDMMVQVLDHEVLRQQIEKKMRAVGSD